MEYIKWKKKDILTLKKAISQFNRKIKQLDKETNKLYLPEKLEFSEVKKDIKTRNELNRVLSSLREYNKETAKTIILQSGEEISKWDYSVLKKQRKILETRINKELKGLSIPKKGEKYSRLQMGSERARELFRTLENIQELELKKGEAFKRTKSRIQTQGTYDYQLEKSRVYRENFIKSLEELKENNPEFEKVYEYFNNIKNPINFFETVQRSNAIQDFFKWYKKPEDYVNFSSPRRIIRIYY